MRFVIVLIALMSDPLIAYDILDVSRLDVEYNKLDPNTRDPYAPQYTGRWKDRAALQWDLSVLNYGYWNNWVHTETVDPSGQPKTVGWKWELGVHLGNYLDIYELHHSRHIMDEPPPTDRDSNSNSFPVESGWGIRIHLIREKK